MIVPWDKNVSELRVAVAQLYKYTDVTRVVVTDEGRIRVGRVTGVWEPPEYSREYTARHTEMAWSPLDLDLMATVVNGWVGSMPGEVRDRKIELYIYLLGAECSPTFSDVAHRAFNCATNQIPELSLLALGRAVLKYRREAGRDLK